MRSYVSATLVNTPATRCVFSASVTVSKPKCVSRSTFPVLASSFLGVAPPSCAVFAVEEENGRILVVVPVIPLDCGAERINRAEVLQMCRGVAIVTNWGVGGAPSLCVPCLKLT